MPGMQVCLIKYNANSTAYGGRLKIEVVAFALYVFMYIAIHAEFCNIKQVKFLRYKNTIKEQQV